MFLRTGPAPPSVRQYQANSGSRGQMGALIGEAGREAFARRVRLEMAKQGITREALAERADVKERTLGNLLAGHPVRDLTVAKIARVLTIGLDELVGPIAPGERATGATPAPESARAGEAYGGYMLSSFEAYIGTYIGVRRVFTEGAELYRSVFEIDWDEGLCRLRFLEMQRFRGADHRAVSSSHAGGIHISPHTGLIQLLTTYQGALRLITLTKFRMGDNRMRGLILTQSDRDRYFQPAVSAIYLEKLEGKSRWADLDKLLGPVGPDDPAFAAAAAELDQIERTSVFMAATRD